MQNFGTSPLEILACEAMLGGLVYLDQFTYSAAWTSSNPLTTTGTIPVNIQIDGDSDFIMQSVNLTAFTSANPPVVISSPNYLITISRAGSGRQIMNQPQHVQNLCGNYWNNSFPGVWPMPGLLQAKNTITVALQNLSTAQPGRVDVALVGFKVFYRGSTDRTQVFNLSGFAL